MRWFGKSKKQQDLREPDQPVGADHVELVSLHIPKTAGTSFRNILKSVYGEDAVIRFDINQQGNVKINETDFVQARIPEAVRVLHGHFHAANFQKLVRVRSDVPWITWLRHPVDRVISNYYYLDEVLTGIVKEANRALNIQSKMQRTLLEYAQTEVARNVISKFLKGRALEDFAFIGLQEQFESDLPILARKLNWPEIPSILYHNTTSNKKRNISDDVRNRIAELNAEDMVIYQKALALREKAGTE